MSSEVDEFVTKNGFTFKRKRKNDEEDRDVKKVKKNDEIPSKKQNDAVEVPLPKSEKAQKKEIEIPKKSILRESKFSSKNDEDHVQNEKIESRRPLADKGNSRSTSREPTKAEKTQEYYHSKNPHSRNEEYKRENGKENQREFKILKLPPFPTTWVPREFDNDEYERIDPFSRLGKMFEELCIQQKEILQKEYKDHPLFLNMVDKFIQRTQSESNDQILNRVKSRSKSSLRPKENLQNIYALQKRTILENMISSYEGEIKSIEKYIEENVDTNKVEGIAKSFLKTLEGAGQLTLDMKLAQKVDSKREEFDKELSVKIKKSLSTFNTYEKMMNDIEKESRALEKTLEKQTRQAHDKIFGEYLAVFETDPADIVNEFLSFSSL